MRTALIIFAALTMSAYAQTTIIAPDTSKATPREVMEYAKTNTNYEGTGLELEYNGDRALKLTYTHQTLTKQQKLDFLDTFPAWTFEGETDLDVNTKSVDTIYEDLPIELQVVVDTVVELMRQSVTITNEAALTEENAKSVGKSKSRERRGLPSK